jgi:hypothetical protein
VARNVAHARTHSFVKDCRSGVYEMKELCERYGISRKTGYKWLDRFEAEGSSGLEDRSRAPQRCRHGITVDVREILLAARRRHPTWWPKTAEVARGASTRYRLAGGEQRRGSLAARGPGRDSRLAPAKRSASGGRQSHRPATALQSLPRDLQPRAASPATTREHKNYAADVVPMLPVYLLPMFPVAQSVQCQQCDLVSSQ